MTVCRQEGSLQLLETCYNPSIQTKLLKTNPVAKQPFPGPSSVVYRS